MFTTRMELQGMASYWWVNHRKTHRQEIDGEYLWSPKREANNSQSHYYDNMRMARPGDFVLSMASARIQYVGRVTSRALSSPKPDEFGSLGANWSADGWLLPVIWSLLPNEVRPKERLDDVAPLLRPRYAPIQAITGNGNQKAYLCEIDKALFDAIMSFAGAEQEALFELLPTYGLSGQVEVMLEAKVTKIIATDTSLSATEKVQLQKARLGQGKFRANVLAVEHRCRITGVDNPELLVASHIKPWRSCEDSRERLDGFNGLLLTPHVDYLFDKGLISFRDTGELMISDSLHVGDIERLGLTRSFATYTGSFHSQHWPYLKYHRENVLL